VSDEPPDKIVISRQDLAAKRVDDVLSQQLSFGAPVAMAPPVKAAWYYKPWFVLTLAGGIGAFLAWAIIEPFFDDGVRIVGRIEEVDPQAAHAGAPLLGRLRVSGVTVWILSKGGTLEVDGREEPLTAEKLKEGQVVEVLGEATDDGNATVLVARDVTVRYDAGTDLPKPDLEATQIRQLVAALLGFPLIAGFVGLAIACADGLVSRAWSRAAVSALVGMALGFGVGLVMTFVGGIAYAMLSHLAQSLDTQSEAMKMSTGAFLVQTMGRGVSWALIGIAMGMGQGIALRSKKLFINGLIGGVVGGLLGGLLFDPINYAMGGGQFARSADASRAVGFTCIGLCTGLMIGIVELIAREAWLKMLAGPLAGKEFILYRDPTTIGSSPKREIYLFKDPDVEPEHAQIVKAGEGYELVDKKSPAGTFVNGRKVTRQRLRSQDQIRIGSTVLLFTMKED